MECNTLYDSELCAYDQSFWENLLLNLMMYLKSILKFGEIVYRNSKAWWTIHHKHRGRDSLFCKLTYGRQYAINAP